MDILQNLSPLGITFLILILLCSIIGVATAVFKAYNLYFVNIISDASKAETIYPEQLSTEHQSDQFLQFILSQTSRNNNALNTAAEAESKAYIIHWETGLNVLEMIITIAPLLGILGTASGLFEIFISIGQSDSTGDDAYTEIASGISTALITTIAGLAVAVPMVVLHSAFVRKIEILKSDFERIGTKFIQQISE